MLPRATRALVSAGFALASASTALATAPLPPPEFWPTGGLAVAAEPGAQRLSDVASDDDGGAFVAWTHQPNPYTMYLYLQHVTFQGHLDWSTGTTERIGPQFGKALGYRIVPDGSRGVIAIWSDGNVVYALRVRSDGVSQPGWPADGLRVSGPNGSQSQPVLAQDGQGGAYIVWQDSRTRQIYAQHVLGTGALGWTANGVRVGTGDEMESQPALTTCPDGSVYVSWVAESVDPASADIRLNRITSSGIPGPGWPVGGLVLTAASDRQDMPSVVPDGNDGVYAVWRDYRNHESRSDVYAQRVNLNTLFPAGWGGDGVAVCTDTLDQGVPLAAADKQRGVLISWFSARQVHVQRLTPSGSPAPGWSEQGVSVGTVTATGQGLALVDDAEGGAFAAWNDSRGPSPLDVYTQHIGASGAPAYDWPVTGAPVSAASGVEMIAGTDARMSMMVNSSWRGPIVAWTSGLEGSHPDVYAQRLWWNGTIGPWGRPFGNGCCNAVERLSPNPSRGQVRLQVRIPTGGTSGVLDICDARGRRVRTQPCPDLRPGWGNLIDVDLKGLPSGVYYVKVSERAGGPAVGSAPVVLVR